MNGVESLIIEIQPESELNIEIQPVEKVEGQEQEMLPDLVMIYRLAKI